MGSHLCILKCEYIFTGVRMGYIILEGDGWGNINVVQTIWAIDIYYSIHYIYIHIYAYSIQICLSIFAARLDALWFCQQEIHADKDFRLFAAKWWSHANVSWPPELAEKKSLPLGFLCPCGLEFWILCSLFNGKMFLKKMQMCLQGSTWQRKSDKKACGGHKTTKHTSLLGNRG